MTPARLALRVVEMRELFDQVEAVASTRLYYIALMSALAIPDICAAMESENGEANRPKYEGWFDRHVAPRYETRWGCTLDGTTAYQFRCSMLHQGRTQHKAGTYSRLLFLEPGASRTVMHNNILNDALNIDVSIFCTDVVDAAREWITEAEQLPAYQRNFPLFVQRYADGFAPYIGGIPVIT
jgi:hypothetical protein